MGKKLGKNEYPAGLGPSDFKCSGPCATEDTNFSTARIADMGCFSQEDVDSNKYYHVCMCQDNSGTWYVYVEYGREGASKPQFQWIACSGESDARSEFVSKCNEKNTSRGKWDVVGGIRMFVNKPGKDLYRVRQLAKRSHGLPDARAVTNESFAPAASTPDAKAGGAKKKPAYRCDEKTTKLMRDLLGGAVTYTRSVIQGGTIPVKASIDEARNFLDAARRQIGVVGNNLDNQIKDKDLRDLSYALYSRIPKIKPLHCPDKDWILSQDNIVNWENDLDAFESALQAGSVEHIEKDDPMADFKVDMSWIDPKSTTGEWLYRWWPAATLNRHGGVGKMQITNLWKLSRHGDESQFNKELGKVCKEIGNFNIKERPFTSDKNRPDIDGKAREAFHTANVGLMCHGTRSVNVSGIIRKGILLPKNLTAGIVVTGRMFGDGKYWASDWKKSAGYTSLTNSYYSAGNGSVKGRNAFMFLADVILGNPYIAPHSGGYNKAPKGFHTVLGKAGVSGVMNDEWITYDNERDKLVYLAEFTTTGR